MRIGDWSSDVCSSDLVVESGILRLSHSTGFVGEKVRLRGRECRAPTSYLLRGHAPAPTASGAPRDLSGGQQLFQLQSSRGFVDLLDRRQLARQPVQRGLTHLALAGGLVGLIGAAMQTAHHLGDRHRNAGIDRKSGVYGKGVTVRLDTGCSRKIK